MAKPAPLALLVVLLCAAGLACWLAGGSGEEPAPAATANAAQERAAVEGAGGAVEQLPTEAKREEVAKEPEVPPELALPFAYSLRVRAVDEFGLPVKDQRIRFSPIDCTRNRTSEMTDGNGCTTISWRGRTRSMRMAIAVGQNATREIQVESGSPRNLTLLAAQASRGPRLKLTRAKNSADHSFEMQLLADDSDQATGSTSKDRTIDELRGMHPDAMFGDSLLTEAQGVAEVQTFADVELMIGSFLVRTQSFDESTRAEIAVPTTGELTGIVYGEDGKPAPNQMLCYGPTPDQPVERGTSDADGRFRFENVAPGFVEVRAGGGAAGLARQTVQVVAGQTASATLSLRREQRIVGKAFGIEGQPLANWHVEYEALDGSWADRTRIKDDGTFVLANLPGGAGRLLLREEPDSVPASIVASALPDSGEVVFDLSGEHAPNGSLVVRVPELPKPTEGPIVPVASADPLADPNGWSIHTSGPQPESLAVPITLTSPSFTEVSVSYGFAKSNPLGGHLVAFSPPAPMPKEGTVTAWQQESHLGFAVPRAQDGAFACGRLPAGFYRIEFRCTGLGAVDLGTHWLDGKGRLDLGTVPLPQPAQCRLRDVPHGATVELYHRRAHGDVMAREPLGGRLEVDLPAGTWLAVWRVGDGPIRCREFALRAGEATDVSLAN